MYQEIYFSCLDSGHFAAILAEKCQGQNMGIKGVKKCLSPNNWRSEYVHFRMYTNVTQ